MVSCEVCGSVNRKLVQDLPHPSGDWMRVGCSQCLSNRRAHPCKGLTQVKAAYFGPLPPKYGGGPAAEGWHHLLTCGHAVFDRGFSSPAAWCRCYACESPPMIDYVTCKAVRPERVTGPSAVTAD